MLGGYRAHLVSLQCLVVLEISSPAGRIADHDDALPDLYQITRIECMHDDTDRRAYQLANCQSMACTRIRPLTS